jgi:hypothetical protein
MTSDITEPAPDAELADLVCRYLDNRLDATQRDRLESRIQQEPGTIIPLGKVVQNTKETSLDPLTLLVCPDAAGNAIGSLYEDAGDGYGYQTWRLPPHHLPCPNQEWQGERHHRQSRRQASVRMSELRGPSGADASLSTDSLQITIQLK